MYLSCVKLSICGVCAPLAALQFPPACPHTEDQMRFCCNDQMDQHVGVSCAETGTALLEYCGVCDADNHLQNSWCIVEKINLKLHKTPDFFVFLFVLLLLLLI